MEVYCYPVSRESKHVPLLFEGIEHRYRPVPLEGSLRPAITAVGQDRSAIVHLHWEEFVLRDCVTERDANLAAGGFTEELAALAGRGVTIFWTVHNALPHMIGFHTQFLALRRHVASLADCILVHNTASIAVLSEQVRLDPSRLRLLSHPSYLGFYEPETTLASGLNQPFDRRIQGFGWIRLQKGFGEMIDMLPPDFLEPRGLRVRISGDGEEADAVIARQAHRSDVGWDVCHVPDAEAAALLRSSACVVLPYERVLTSGVALLAISVGAMLVAVDIPQMRELLPPASQRFLYTRGDPDALRSAIDAVLALTPLARAEIVAGNLAVARDLHPRRIARCLADLYDAASSSRSPRISSPISGA